MSTIICEIIKIKNSSCCLCSDGTYINTYGEMNRDMEVFSSEEEAVNAFFRYLKETKFWIKYNGAKTIKSKKAGLVTNYK